MTYLHGTEFKLSYACILGVNSGEAWGGQKHNSYFRAHTLMIIFVPLNEILTDSESLMGTEYSSKKKKKIKKRVQA